MDKKVTSVGYVKYEGRIWIDREDLVKWLLSHEGGVDPRSAAEMLLEIKP